MPDFAYATKLDALLEISDIDDIKSRWTCRKISLDSFLRIISKPSYSLKTDMGMSAQGISDVLRSAFPDRPKSTGKVCYYLLAKYGLKYCVKCTKVYTEDAFHGGLRESYCKPCFNMVARDCRREYQAHKRALLMNRTPSWANLGMIREIYSNCPEGYHVDHVVPLQGELVSGLHVEYNLQYLLARDNIVKSNSFTPG